MFETLTVAMSLFSTLFFTIDHQEGLDSSGVVTFLMMLSSVLNAFITTTTLTQLYIIIQKDLVNCHEQRKRYPKRIE